MLLIQKKSKITLIHIITSRHHFKHNINISNSNVCMFSGASKQTQYVEP